MYSHFDSYLLSNLTPTHLSACRKVCDLASHEAIVSQSLGVSRAGSLKIPQARISSTLRAVGSYKRLQVLPECEKCEGLSDSLSLENECPDHMGTYAEMSLDQEALLGPLGMPEVMPIDLALTKTISQQIKDLDLSLETMMLTVDNPPLILSQDVDLGSLEVNQGPSDLNHLEDLDLGTQDPVEMRQQDTDCQGPRTAQLLRQVSIGYFTAASAVAGGRVGILALGSPALPDGTPSPIAGPFRPSLGTNILEVQEWQAPSIEETGDQM